MTYGVSPLEMAAAYGAFANEGVRVQPTVIRRMETASGELIYRGPESERVTSPGVAYLMTEMLQAVVTDGTGRRAALTPGNQGIPVAGKTGTTTSLRDAWFIGYTANLTTGVWFGNDDGAPTKNMTGGSLPAIAWNEFMTAAHEGVPVAGLPGRWNGRVFSDIEGILQSHGGGEPASSAPDHTASIDRPVPPAEVGAPAPRRVGSIMDVLLGN